MPKEFICNLTGARKRQVIASGVARGEFITALAELDAGQTELAEMYAAKEGHSEGKFGFEQRGRDIALVRIVEEDGTTELAPAP